eukprot:TRINITY_DN92060_c0_g1_i1.p1 TRINITY_DN92060_c0_g1~~TRINITY_DN92060_c0_g1_i1.p1  ORF type:complete len:408 (-),score=49.91 TRINITY_DN92060_c0_g1_i1:182-1348(-)
MLLMLGSNNFFGQLPESMSKIRRLLMMDLSDNNFSGDKFPKFDPDSYLFYVDLSFNKFYGQIPMSFGEGIKLLSLGQNEFSGELPATLANLSSLEHLDLRNNRITGNLPGFIFQISTLKTLNLRNNSLEGSIPNVSSTSLQILDLSNNNLIGSVPSTFGNLTGMIETPKTFFFISDIFTFLLNLNDVIVNWKGSMRPLASKNLDIYSFLDMSRNQLSGDIPATLGNLRGLKTLSLSYNKLFGRIPMSFGSLENLESLDLSHNHLSGEIPETFTKLLQLSTLDLSNNNLAGQIPSGGQMDRMNDPNDFANNSGLCGVQIYVSCSMPSSLESLNEEHHESWFSWEGAGIGFPLGLFSTLATIYFAGFLSLSPKQHKMRNHNQRRRQLRRM